jgi:hypothetical protein
MTTNPLRVSWAGPAVAGALLLAALTPLPAAGAPVTIVAAGAAAHMEVICAKEALDYALAVSGWINAWRDYQNTLPGGTQQEILDSAARLDVATSRVGDTGLRLIACLLGASGGGPRPPA